MTVQVTDQTVIVVSETQVSGDLVDGEVAILNLKDGVYYGLNSVGGRVWSLIQEPKTIRTVIDTLLEEFDVNPDRCRAEVLALVTALAEHNLVKLDP